MLYVTSIAFIGAGATLSSPGSLAPYLEQRPCCAFRPEHEHTPFGKKWTPKRARVSVQGRADSARAEELLAGLGYNIQGVGELEDGQGRRQRRTRGGGKGAEKKQSSTRRGNPAQPPKFEDCGANGHGADPVEGREATPRGSGKDWSFLQTHDFVITADEALSFERNGHTVTRGLFSDAELALLRSSVMAGFRHEEKLALRQKVSVWFGDDAAKSLRTVAELRARLKRISPDDVPFLQLFNMHRREGPHRRNIRDLVRSPRLTHVAAQLLGCERLRLYQDSVFVKRAGDGPTRWHSDLNMAPLDTNDFVTAWLPLESVPSRKDGGTPLVFASRSHRDFALNHWQDPRWLNDLNGRYLKTDHAPLAAGDVTWHHGWTLHSSPSNSRGKTRAAIAISYVRDGARLLSADARRAPDPEDSWSYSDWIRDVKPGAVVRHSALPLVWNQGRPVPSDEDDEFSR